MIIKTKETKLVEIYLYICEKYEEELKYCCERFSNNDKPELTDQEIMTIYLFVIFEEQRFKVKQIHRFANEYLRSWFPKLGSYSAFCNRLNRLSEAFRVLVSQLLSENQPSCNFNQSVLDSMPIITCSGKRTGLIAQELTDKSFCSTKNLWYYGLKLHVLGFTNTGRLPHPESIILNPASHNDLNIFKESWFELTNREFYGDKIYFDTEFFSDLLITKKSVMFTPIKAIKNQCDRLNQFDRAYNDLYSKAVSKIRQPIESLFNWLIEKTDFQRASKVRSSKGLLVHVFGKIAAAFIYLIFNP